MLIDVEII